MANTTVTDALFMANVTKVSALESSKKAQADGLVFSTVMSEASLKTAGTDSKGSAFDIPKTQETNFSDSRRNSVENKLNNKSDSITENSKTDKAEDVAKETLKQSEGIKNEVKDKLGVSDEEIENAMETLGLMAQDLLNPNALKDLMMTLSNVSDSLELLTNADLYEGMQQILDAAGVAATSIMEEFSLTESDFMEMLSNDELFGQVIAEIENSGLINDTFGPSEENVALQAEAPAIAPDDDSKEGKGTTVEVTVTRNEHAAAGNTSGTETFKNVSRTDKTELNNDNNASNMFQTVTTTVNELGEVVETIESFSEGFADAREIASQVTERIKVDFSGDTTTMEMQLHPATLGTVNMQISSQNGVVTAHLLVQNEAVKSALESQLAILQETFEEQGHEVSAVEVSVANYDLNRGMNQNADSEQERENALRAGRAARRRLRLDEISDEEMEELMDEERITADMMRRNGNMVDFMA